MAGQENPIGAVKAPKKQFYKRWWFWGIVVVAAVAIVGRGTNGSIPKGGSGDAAIQVVIPPAEAQFIQIVATAQSESHGAENDMQRGGVKAKRDKAVCAALSSVAVSDWVGTIDKIDSNSDGKGVLAINLANGIKVATWNNALSDISSKTLIEPGTQLFTDASAMKPGQMIIFSGTFINGSAGECIEEQSMTLRGKIEDPAFTFRFASVSANLPNTKSMVTQPVAATPAVSPANPSPTTSPISAQTAPAQTALTEPPQASPQQVTDGQPLEVAEMLSTYKASFDCAKASTAVEKLTCATPILSQLDGLLSGTYKSRMNDPAFGVDKAAFKADQMAWIKTKNACANSACLEKTYRARITDLCEMPVASGVHPVGDCDTIEN